jgi:isoleucyl-tRNA synthetase
LKVRQPLKEAFIISSDAKTLTLLSNMQELIKEELNVQKVAFTRDETAFVQLSIKPNFRVLGKKIGKFMKQAAAHISTLLPDQCTALQAGKSISFVLEGTEVIIDPEDVVIERIVKPGIHAATAQHITVALDIELNDELIQQGIVRELINKINTLRKELRFLISDRIHLLIECSPEIKKAIELHKSHISNEVLALSIMFGTNSGSQIEINEELLTLTLTKGT